MVHHYDQLARLWVCHVVLSIVGLKRCTERMPCNLDAAREQIHTTMKAVCFYCQKCFASQQGRRAHQRFCQAYKLSKGLPIDRHADANPVSQPRVPSQRQRSEWVSICDYLRKLLALAVGHTRIAKLMNFRYEQEELWRQLFYELHQLLDLTWNQVSGVQPTISPNELVCEAVLCSGTVDGLSCCTLSRRRRGIDCY